MAAGQLEVKTESLHKRLKEPAFVHFSASAAPTWQIVKCQRFPSQIKLWPWLLAGQRIEVPAHCTISSQLPKAAGRRLKSAYQH